MITDAVAAKVPAAWVTADEVYGDNGAFRTKVAKLGLGYVLAVSCDHRIPAFPGGRRRLRAGPLPGAELDRLAPARHPGHARPGIPDGQRCRRGTGTGPAR
jgi:SRSO17 transposase